MTRLEEEIKEAMVNALDNQHNLPIAAAEVAKKYTKKAFDAGVFFRERYCEFEGATDKDYEEHCNEANEKWLKENGIV